MWLHKGLYGVLAAIGYSRRRLVGRIVAETALLTTGGWLVGAGLTYLALTYLARSVFRGRGLFLDPTDFWAYEHTLPIPISITAFAVQVIGPALPGKGAPAPVAGIGIVGHCVITSL